MKFRAEVADEAASAGYAAAQEAVAEVASSLRDVAAEDGGVVTVSTASGIVIGVARSSDLSEFTVPAGDSSVLSHPATHQK